MSIAACTRVWSCRRRNTRKLLLLALANYADDRGVCWPSTATIATLIGEDEKYTRHLIQEAERDGDLVRKAGGGRGIPSVYGITVDLSDAERADLARIVRVTVIKRGQRMIAIDGEVVPYVAGLETKTDRLTATQNPPPQSRVLVEHTPPPPPTPKRSSRSAGLPAHVAYLRQHGMGAAHLFADLDPAAAIADFDARIADQWSVPAIVTHWKEQPPTPERIYRGRHHADPNHAERPAASHQRTNGKPKLGERDYYRNRS